MPNYAGEMCALGAALAWALAVMCFKRSGERISPVALNLFKNAVAIVLLAVTLVVTAAYARGDGTRGLDVLLTASMADVLTLAVSGIIGISIADTLFFRGLNLCGVGLVSVVDCT
jgi:drug/metabolite transporter (DMT)-like permease